MREGTIHVVQKMAPGGIELLVRDLAEQIPGPNLVFSLEGSARRVMDNWPSLWLLDADVKTFSKGPGVNFELIRTMAKKLRDLKPKAVVTHHIGPLLYGGLAARLARVPVIAHVEHDTWHYELPRHRLLTRLACMTVRPQVIGVSRPAAKVIAKVSGRADVKVITNGVDLERFTPRDMAKSRAGWKLPQDVPIIGAVGRHEEVKGFDILLEAMAAVPSDAVLVMAGAGSKTSELEAQARKLGIANRVKFLGFQTNVATLFPAFDVFCLPSRAEGLPLTLLEAQACGVRSVATDVGAVSEALCPASGLLVPSEDPGALAQTLSKALANPAEQSPRQYVARKFSWKDTLNAYKNLTGAR